MDYRGSSRVGSPDRLQVGGEATSPMGRGELCYGSGRHIAKCTFIAIISSLIVASFQSGFFSVVRPLGIAPDLCLAFTASCGLLFGSRFGALVGVASGFFIDALSIGGLSVNIVLYLLCGAVIGLIRIPETRPFRDVWRYLAAILTASCLKKLVEALWVVLTAPSLDASKLYIDLVVRGIICTTICSLGVYLPTSAVYLILRSSTVGKKKY